MASAINHKKRSHRSHKGHMQAAAHMKGVCAPAAGALHRAERPGDHAGPGETGQGPPR